MNKPLDSDAAVELAECLAGFPPAAVLFQTEPCGHCAYLVVWVSAVPTPYWYCSTCDCRWTAEGEVWPRADFCDNGQAIIREE